MDNRTPTTLTITATQVSRNNIVFQVQLADDNNTNLSGKPINFYLDDTLKSIRNTNTNGLGNYTFIGSSGEHTLKAEFEGDDDYQPSMVTTMVTIQ